MKYSKFFFICEKSNFLNVFKSSTYYIGLKNPYYKEYSFLITKNTSKPDKISGSPYTCIKDESNTLPRLFTSNHQNGLEASELYVLLDNGVSAVSYKVRPGE